MEFFGISATDLMVILVIAIVVFGPDKIPTMAGQIAKTIREFRRYTSELTKEFNEATGGLKDELQTTIADLRGELEATQADLRSQLDLTGIMQETVAAANGTAPVAAVGAGAPVATQEAAAPSVAESAADETITVLTPYAEAQAAAAAAVDGTAAPVVTTNGHAVATRADPFADLVNLTAGASTPDEIDVITPAVAASDEMPAAPALAAVAAPVVADTPISENGAKRPANGRAKIGTSVAGSKYTRRKSS